VPSQHKEPVDESKWTASQLVAFNLVQARRRAGLTQQQAAEAISHYTDTAWTQATYATAEASVTGTRIRSFTPAELLAFCFVFDVPIGWFFMPPPNGEAEALHMAKHSDGIGWDWVFGRTTPTQANIDPYLTHQSDWVRRSETETEQRPFHHRAGHVLGAAYRTLNDNELQTHFLLGLFRRGLGKPFELQDQTSLDEKQWFADASVVLNRVARAFAVIGRRETSPSWTLYDEDLEDAGHNNDAT
jgi:hypothetical protein